jgi:hypothetical protein
MKNNADRISYYTRKANEYGALRFDQVRGRTSRRVSQYRYFRLRQYKAALAERLRREGDDLNRILLVFEPVTTK